MNFESEGKNSTWKIDCERFEEPDRNIHTPLRLCVSSCGLDWPSVAELKLLELVMDTGEESKRGNREGKPGRENSL